MKNEDLLGFGGFGSGMLMGAGLFVLGLCVSLNDFSKIRVSFLLIIASTILFTYLLRLNKYEKR